MSLLQPHPCLASLPPFPDSSDQVRVLQLCRCCASLYLYYINIWILHATPLYYVHVLTHLLPTQVLLMTVGPTWSIRVLWSVETRLLWSGKGLVPILTTGYRTFSVPLMVVLFHPVSQKYSCIVSHLKSWLPVSLPPLSLSISQWQYYSRVGSPMQLVTTV